MKLAEIAEFLQGELVGNPELQINGLAKIQTAEPGQLTFLANPKYAKYLESTKASAVLIAEDQVTPAIAHIKIKDPYLAFLEILNIYYPANEPDFEGIHPTAIVADSASIGENSKIGPNVYIGKSVVIGENTVIYPNCVLLDNVHIGKDCRLYPCVSVRERCRIGDRVIIHDSTVIGSDGFGFAPEGKKYNKIPQMGIVVIEDDVEIGANSTIDRATLGETIIKKGCKIDNLVQIAHNVIVGENTVIVAQTGVSGSTKIGKHVTLAGQVGVVGHVEIGDDAIVAAQSGISKNVPSGEVWFGSPALPIMRQKKIEASLRQLPDMIKKIKALTNKINELEKQVDLLGGGDERQTKDN
jgi:UDP-3-O-[3-hydroxymyristoyl] glucosamine N-acyltransferase